MHFFKYPKKKRLGESGRILANFWVKNKSLYFVFVWLFKNLIKKNTFFFELSILAVFRLLLATTCFFFEKNVTFFPKKVYIVVFSRFFSHFFFLQFVIDPFYRVLGPYRIVFLIQIGFISYKKNDFLQIKKNTKKTLKMHTKFVLFHVIFIPKTSIFHCFF